MRRKRRWKRYPIRQKHVINKPVVWMRTSDIIRQYDQWVDMRAIEKAIQMFMWGVSWPTIRITSNKVDGYEYVLAAKILGIKRLPVIFEK